MSLQIQGLNNKIFKHSRDYSQGGGKIRKGMGTFIVALDGSGDFDDIQEAINAIPKTGGEIFIKEGTYNGFSLNKSKITIEGTGEGTIIKDKIAGAGGGIIIYITKGSVSISKIKVLVENLNWTGIQITNNLTKIKLNKIITDGGNYGATAGIFTDGEGMSNILITECIIENYETGINIGGSNNIISSCLLNSCDIGIQTDGLINSTINGNTSSNNTGRGIILSDNNFSSNFNTLNGNTSTGNATQGIEIFGLCSKNLIIGNISTGNNNGILLSIPQAGRVPDKNLIIGNIVLNNTTAQITDNGTNTVLANNITT